MQCHNSDCLLPDQLQTQSPGISRMDVKHAHLLRLFGRLHTISSHQVNKLEQTIFRCFHDLIALSFAFKPFRLILGHHCNSNINLIFLLFRTIRELRPQSYPTKFIPINLNEEGNIYHLEQRRFLIFFY